MGQLINGKWDSNDEAQSNANTYGHSLGTDAFPFDKNSAKFRYHLYVARSCPFAQRADIALHLTKLDSQIGLSITDPVATNQGWAFANLAENKTSDLVYNKHFLHEVYTELEPSYTGRVTVPLLVDTQTNQIVSKESAEIVAMLAKINQAAPDLEANAAEQEKASHWFGQFFGNAMRVGQARTQSVYNQAISEFYATTNEFNEFLKSHPQFLAGDHVTKVDILTFPALEFLEAGMATKVLITGNRLRDYPYIDRYIKRFYQQPGVKTAIDVTHIQASLGAEINKNKFVAPKDEHISLALPQPNWDEPIRD